MIQRSYVKFLATFAIIAVGLAFAYCKEAPPAKVEWSYEGATGPENWGDLSPDFAACKTGMEQSPIDITGAGDADLPALELNYNPASYEVVNNGHTIQVNLEGAGNLKVGDDTYDLLQFHFHTPSEEAINGKRFPLDVHFVHKSAAGELAVIGLLFEEGAANEQLAAFWSQMPTEANATNKGEGKLDPAAIIGTELSYYTFKGSLTTPPCSEGVRWLVLQTPTTIGADQLAAFQSIYDMNARPIQPLNDREIQASR
jgi:carbonic anhydrase